MAGQAWFHMLLPRRTRHHGLGSFHLLVASPGTDVDTGFQWRLSCRHHNEFWPLWLWQALGRVCWVSSTGKYWQPLSVHCSPPHTPPTLVQERLTRNQNDPYVFQSALFCSVWHPFTFPPMECMDKWPTEPKVGRKKCLVPGYLEDKSLRVSSASPLINKNFSASRAFIPRLPKRHPKQVYLG